MRRVSERLSFVLLSLLPKAALRGVEGKAHQVNCSSCRRQILGHRFSRPYSFLPQDRPNYEEEYNLCRACFAARSEGDQLADPYWILIPALIQSGYIEVRSYFRFLKF